MSVFINGWTKESVIKHIEKNFKGKAINKSNGICYYKKGIKKCAVGMFIPDGHLGQKHVGTSTTLLHNYPELKESMPLAYMDEFQRIHDHDDYNTGEDKRLDEEVLMDLVSYICSLD